MSEVEGWRGGRWRRRVVNEWIVMEWGDGEEGGGVRRFGVN